MYLTRWKSREVTMAYLWARFQARGRATCVPQNRSVVNRERKRYVSPPSPSSPDRMGHVHETVGFSVAR